MKLNCYIIDDEPLAIEVLESHIDKYDQLEIAGTFQNAVKAFQSLQSESIDLIFLDIQMPKLTGIELLKSLKEPPEVIFTTAYREFALEGFELDAVDYLLKPISFERFLKAMSKLTSKINPQVTPTVKPQTQDPFLFIQIDKKMVKIQLGNILYIESQRDYVSIKTESKDILAHQQISSLEERLPADRFLRIHRSFIVPMGKIESWSASEIEVPGKTLPIGRTYKREVLEKLESRSNIL